MKRKLGRLGALIMIVALLIPLCVPGALAADVTDIKGHWAETQINRWIYLGYISGYTDNTFRPDSPISRAEFMALVNRAFGYTTAGYISYADVGTNDWYYRTVQIASYRGYITGYSDNTMRPNAQITRQEVAVMLTRILNLSPNAVPAQNYADYGKIDAWSSGAIGAVTQAGLMSGYGDNTFRAKANMSRAESVVALARALDKQPGQEVIQDVTVTSSSYGNSSTQTINGNLYIDYSGNVSLLNLVVKGNIVVRSKVGDKTVTMKNVTCEGRLQQDYGSLVLDGCTIKTLESSYKDSTITIKNSSNVTSAVVSQATTIDQTGLSSTSTYKGIQTLEISGPSSAKFTLKGYFPRVNITAKNQNVTLASGTIENLSVTATGLDMTIASNTYVDYVSFSAAGTLVGAGTVRSAQVNAAGVKLQRKPNSLSGSHTPTYTGESTVTFTTVRSDTDAAINGVKVTFNGETRESATISGNVGRVVFNNVPRGSQSYTAKLSGYSDKTETINVNADNFSHTIKLVPAGNYSATFVVLLSDMSAGNYNGSTVRVDNGSTYTTNSDGKVTVNNLSNGNHTYTVTKRTTNPIAEYEVKTGSFNINNGNITVPNITLAPTQLVVTVKLGGAAVNDFQAAVDGVDGGAYVSATNGSVIFAKKLTFNGTYTVRVKGATIPETTMSIKIDAQPKAAVFSFNTYTISVKETVGGGGAAIADAVVTLGGVSPNSAAGGSYVFNNVVAGNHALSVTKAGYVAHSETLAVTGTGTKTVELKKTYDFTVSVSGYNSGALAGATVKIGNNTATDEGGGTYKFTSIPEGSYTLEVSAPNHTAQSPNITVNATTAAVSPLTTVSLSAAHTVTITVNDGTNAIQGATVSFGSFSGITDGSGTVTFTGVPASTYTDLAVSATGFVTQSNLNLAVNGDPATTVTETVSLTATP
ncbi:S-layer homology domain-containing protein [Oscillospiraceae bacterium OttesenSCG-928-G22]|nr:S-layer homology domain-containing protein [Oscillospiraceae bacterium OttesenSCG-928-G22]